jgi:ATP-dependent 26S proteasome regulatory subunit
VEDIRGSPLGVATLEEMVDDNHAIISSSIGPEYYVNIMSFVDKVRILTRFQCTLPAIRSACTCALRVQIGEFLAFHAHLEQT